MMLRIFSVFDLFVSQRLLMPGPCNVDGRPRVIVWLPTYYNQFYIVTPTDRIILLCAPITYRHISIISWHSVGSHLHFDGKTFSCIFILYSFIFCFFFFFFGFCLSVFAAAVVSCLTLPASCHRPPPCSHSALRSPFISRLFFSSFFFW